MVAVKQVAGGGGVRWDARAQRPVVSEAAERARVRLTTVASRYRHIPAPILKYILEIETERAGRTDRAGGAGDGGAALVSVSVPYRWERKGTGLQAVRELAAASAEIRAGGDRGDGWSEMIP